MPGKEGMIPNYILKTLEEEALEIKFNLDDLSTLYDERNIKIDEESTFYEIIKLCKKRKCSSDTNNRSCFLYTHRMLQF